MGQCYGAIYVTIYVCYLSTCYFYAIYFNATLLSVNMLYNTTVYLLHHFSVYKILVFTSQLLQREWNRIERHTLSKSTKSMGLT